MPKGSSNAASTMLYSEVTHWASVRLMPISSMMVGMETLTIELSSTIMASPRAITHSAPHGGAWAGSGDEAVGFVEEIEDASA